MTTIRSHRTSDSRLSREASTTGDVTTQDSVVTSAPARGALAVLRIGFGLTFLWAFVDKLLALGFSTGRGDTGVVDRFGQAAPPMLL